MPESPNSTLVSPTVWLRLEALAVLVVSTLAYHRLGFGWWHYALLFLLPDLSMLGYLGGRRLGAAMYNLGHTYVLAIACGAICWDADCRSGLGVSLIWIAHIGFDRCLGFGLKHSSGFKDTHLGSLDRKKAPVPALP